MFKMNLFVLSSILVFLTSSLAIGHTIPEKGKKADLVLLPKFLGILPFDHAHKGAREAHNELRNPGKLLYLALNFLKFFLVSNNFSCFIKLIHSLFLNSTV